MTRSTKSSTRNEVFIDTSGFYSLLCQTDDMHKQAVSILTRAGRSGGRFVTSDYVLDETATLLKARGHSRLVDLFFERVNNSQALRIEWMDPDRFEQTRRFFSKHNDKKWSFTDCSSFCLMRQLRLHDALTKDEHFRQAGFNPILR